MVPNQRDLYRFPWSLNDNPIGWLEVTDICNIHCKGCYRQKMVGHKSLEALKEEALPPDLRRRAAVGDTQTVSKPPRAINVSGLRRQIDVS